jgi:O-glycosyl hydrolase
MEAEKLDDFQVIGSVWTPPFWMKGVEVGSFDGTPQIQFDWDEKTRTSIKRLDENGEAMLKMPEFHSDNLAGGSLIDTPDNYEQFGRYIAAWTRAWEDRWGVPISAVSIQNEPAFSVWYNSTTYTPDRYVKALKATYAAFLENDMQTRLFGPEDVGVGVPTDPGLQWRSWSYINAVLADPIASEAMDFWAVHGYDASGAGAPDASGIMWRQFWEGRDDPNYVDAEGNSKSWKALTWPGLASTGKPVWMTEGGGQGDFWVRPEKGGAAGALNLGMSIFHALVDGHVSAYVSWTLTQGADAVTPDTLMENGDTDAPKYVALKHYARYIRPGSVRIDASRNFNSGHAHVLATAFTHEANDTLTVILLNNEDDARSVTLKMGGLADQPAGQTLAAFRSTADERFRRLEDQTAHANGELTLELPPRSLLTLTTQSAVPAGGRR